MAECEEVRSSLTALEVVTGSRDLPPALASHCACCAECREYLAEMERLQGEIRTTAEIPLPPRLLEYLEGIPRRHRALAAARRRVLIPAVLAIALGAPLASVEALLWVTSIMTAAGAFVATSGVTRARLLQD